MVAQWADAFRAAVKTPSAFFHADAAWNAGPTIRNFANSERVVRQRGVPFGIIYNADDAGTDASWAQSAIDHFAEVESDSTVRLDQTIFQSWTANPSQMLPERKTGTLTNVAFQ